MNTNIGPILQGIVVKNIKNINGTYDGILQTTNGNKYYYFNLNNCLNNGSYYYFNMATTNKDFIDFEAVNIKNI